MRYVLAMLFGVAGAAVAARFVASHVAPWVVHQFSYTSPDGEASVEQMAFLGVLAGGLVIGWAIGWMLGAPLGKRRRAR